LKVAGLAAVAGLTWYLVRQQQKKKKLFQFSMN